MEENINLLGISLAQMIDKYNIEFSQDTINHTVGRLTNQLWKLIPMRENNEDWQKQLDTVLIEIVGLNSLFEEKEDIFIQLIAKLEGLSKDETIIFELYRKTIFESISLLHRIK